MTDQAGPPAPDPAGGWARVLADISVCARCWAPVAIVSIDASPAHYDWDGRTNHVCAGAAVPAPPAGPRCKHSLWAVSCGDTGCELHGAYESKWAGRGPSPEREEDFRRVLAAAASSGVPAAARRAPTDVMIDAAQQVLYTFESSHRDFSGEDRSMCEWCDGRGAAGDTATIQHEPACVIGALRAALAAARDGPA